jgi:hypothetical protein
MMLEPTFDSDGYPTDDTLDAIREWDFHDFPALMEFVEAAWSDYGWFGRYGADDGPKLVGIQDPDEDDGCWWCGATGGWSGNESLVAALDQNPMFSVLCWSASIRGGYHEYHVRPLGA